MIIALTKEKLSVYLSTLLVSAIFWAQPFSGGPRVPAILLTIIGFFLLVKGYITLNDQRLRRFVIILLMFVVPVLLSLIGSYDRTNSLKLLVLLPLFIPFAAAILHLLDTKVDKKLYYSVVFLVCCFWGIDGLVQFALGQDFFGIKLWADGNRVVGPFVHHLRLSLFLSISLPLVLFKLKERGWMWQLIYLAFTVFIIMLTGVRTDLLTALIAIFVYVIINKKGRLLLIFMPVFIILTMFASHNSEISEQKLNSFSGIPSGYQEWNKLSSYRLDIWLTAKNMFITNPVLGVGARNFSDTYHNYAGQDNYFADKPVSHAHHPMISIAAETGLIGLGGLLLALVLLFRWGRQCFQKDLIANPWFQILILIFFPIQSMPLLFTLWWFPFVAMVMLFYLNDINDHKQ